jgi:hypothetical protein
MNFFTKIIFPFSIVLLISCKDSKEAVSPEPTNGISLNDQYASFSSPKAFEDFIKNKSSLELKNFTSLADVSPNSEGMPLTLKKVLNKDSIVQIGIWIIKVSTHAKRVSILPSSKKIQYSDLAKNNFANKNILLFRTSDPVLSLLPASLPISCTDVSASSEQIGVDTSVSKYIGDNGSPFTTSIMHQYAQFGIYFELSSHITNYAITSGGIVINQNGYTDLLLKYSFTERCSGISSSSPIEGTYVNDAKYMETPIGPIVDIDNTPGVVNGLLYAGTAGLKSYSLSTTGRFKDDCFQSNGGPLPQTTLTPIIF